LIHKERERKKEGLFYHEVESVFKRQHGVRERVGEEAQVGGLRADERLQARQD
jgi:hypothetical protein